MPDIIEQEELNEEFEKAILVLVKVKERCDAANITYIDNTNPDFEEIDIKINFPNGREHRTIWLLDLYDLERFNSIDFENYTIIGPYSAVYSRDSKSIEAIITAPNTPKYSTNRVRKLLLKNINATEFILEPHNEDSKYQITIKNCSDQIKIITGISGGVDLSLKITGNGIESNEKALKILQQLSNALFFDIEVLTGTFLSLARYNSKQKRDVLKRNVEFAIEYPKNAYDNAPMDLYWYARSAINMPLLQFLAYYQVIEFYYPNFFNVELTKKIRAIIKTPSFRVGNDSDISKILSAIKVKGTSFGAEKEQLKATLRECLDNDEILEYISLNPERISFFNSKTKGITSKLINIQNKNLELYIQVADRIYDIRCKIVHTKGDDLDGDVGVELLLPFSRESEKLDEDIELVRFIAQKILICTSSALPD